MKIRNLVLMTLTSGCLLLSSSPIFAQARILPLGDSVTSSFAPSSSYRYWLWHRLENSGYHVDFVGTQWGVANGAPLKTDFDQNHEGHPGWTTQDGAFYIGSIAPATVPDIVLLDLSANDIDAGIYYKDSATNLMTIIETLRSVNPRVVVLLAQPTPYVGQNKRAMSLLRYAIKRVAAIEKRKGARVVIVNLAASFSPRKDTVDGTHPDESGEKKIASRYYSTLRKYLRR
jgi:lysophospholipase L1-like esterase